MAQLALLDWVVGRLGHVRRSGPSGYSARCPAHEDGRNSLSLRAADGKILMYCHAGCATADVLAEMGLRFRDLFFEE